MSLSPSAIILNQENIFEQKIISKSDFNILIQQYTDSLNARFKEKAFINEEIYNVLIISLYISSLINEEIYNDIMF